MKKIYFIILALFFIGCKSNTKFEKLDHNQSLLWQIEKEGYQTSFIFGTMHLIEEEYYNFSKELTNCIDYTDRVIMELGKMPSPIKAMLMMKSNHTILSDKFSNKQYLELLSFFKTHFNMSEKKFKSTFDGFKPFFLFQYISQAYFTTPTESYDLNIMAYSKKKNKEIIGLETFEEQIGFFESIPESEFINLISESIQSIEEDKLELKELQEIYSQQKVDELVPLLEKQSPELLKYRDVFLTNRNKNWIPKIETAIKKESCFIAVGAGHLFDTNGIIELLKARGFSLTPIKK